MEDRLSMIIQSSLMEYTLKQAVLGKSQVLRYLRSLDLNNTQLTVFCIPSLKSSSA